MGFGITAFSYAECLPLMAAIQVVRAAYDVLAPKGFLGGGPTNYQLYVHILGEGGGGPAPCALDEVFHYGNRFGGGHWLSYLRGLAAGFRVGGSTLRAA